MDIQIQHKKGRMEGMLIVPPSSLGLVLFAHGSGSSRFSPRNNFVAEVLNQGGLATLLIDLLSEEEDSIYETRFDIGLLAERLGAVIAWLQKEKSTEGLALGLFGSSTGAAAALQAAAQLKNQIHAVVSRGGRPDLSMPVLPQVTAPTLLIVGSEDHGVIELNQMAFKQLTCTKELVMVSRATHLFEEPGCLEEVARLSREWFTNYLRK